MVGLRSNLEEPREAAASGDCGAKKDKGFSVLAELGGHKDLGHGFCPLPSYWDRYRGKIHDCLTPHQSYGSTGCHMLQEDDWEALGEEG